MLQQSPETAVKIRAALYQAIQKLLAGSSPCPCLGDLQPACPGQAEGAGVAQLQGKAAQSFQSRWHSQGMESLVRSPQPRVSLWRARPSPSGSLESSCCLLPAALPAPQTP